MKRKTTYDLICALRAAGLWEALTAECNWANIKDCQLFVYEYVQTHENTRRRGYRRRVCVIQKPCIIICYAAVIGALMRILSSMP